VVGRRSGAVEHDKYGGSTYITVEDLQVVGADWHNAARLMLVVIGDAQRGEYVCELVRDR